MFDNDLDELSDTALLAAAAEYGRDQEHAAVGVLRAALAFADRNATIPGYKRLPGCERFVVYGGDGCPEVAEFASVEFGAVLGMSSGAAASLMGEALALRHRLPRVWAAVLSGHALSWRARKIAEACLSLSLEAAAIVDGRVAAIVNTVTPRKLKSITTAAIWEADPEQANANAEAAAKTRGVFVAQSDEHGRSHATSPAPLPQPQPPQANRPARTPPTPPHQVPRRITPTVRAAWTRSLGRRWAGAWQLGWPRSNAMPTATVLAQRAADPAAGAGTRCMCTSPTRLLPPAPAYFGSRTSAHYSPANSANCSATTR
ncbi:DUF222 domain-containing protein [Kribbella sp. NPDC004138]